MTANRQLTEAAPTPADRDGGVNVVGFFRAEFGQGEAARRLLAAVERAGVPFVAITQGDVPHRQEHPFPHESSGPVYGTNILCLNAEHLLTFVHGPDRAVLDGRYSVGIWFWETSRFARFLKPAFDYVDELWVASTFVAEALGAETVKPVLTFPLPVEVPPPPELTRTDVGLPEDRLVFLFLFDFWSTMERKNPLGLVEAFTRAFAPGEGPLLYIKSINGDRMPEQLAELEAAARSHPDIRVVDGFVPADHVRALTALSDCYVSLHRSEGFGLTIAEAMAYGKPAIATRYSGNLTFMEPENSYLVGYQTTTVPEGCPPYPVGAMWADPDLDEAARHMRTVFDHPAEARARGLRGQQTIRERHSIEQTAAFLAERIPAVEHLRRVRVEDEARTPAQGAKQFLVQGPSLPWDVPSPRFGRLGVFARRLLLRLLRPYLVRQREWETLVADALLEAELMNRQHRERIEKLEALLEEALDVRRRGYRAGRGR